MATIFVVTLVALWAIGMPNAFLLALQAGLLAFIFAWNNFIFALILASADKQPVTVGALAFVTASGIQYGQIAAAIVLSITPTLLLALYAQRYLVQGLSLGAVRPETFSLAMGAVVISILGSFSVISVLLATIFVAGIAIRDFEQIVRLDPRSATGYVNAGILYFLEKQDAAKALADSGAGCKMG